jgi:hypothetical protein
MEAVGRLVVAHATTDGTAFLQKPIVPETLTRRVRELLLME